MLDAKNDLAVLTSVEPLDVGTVRFRTRAIILFQPPESYGAS